MKPQIGPPHIRSKLKQARNNNYTLEIANNELLDFPILKCTEIREEIMVYDNKLHELKISDNYENGFENILSEGINNPLNFGHERDDQDNDDEISEFGTGMKQSFAAIGDKITIYTKLIKLNKNIYYKIVLNFPKMETVEDVIDSYNPTLFMPCDEKEYLEHHPFKSGSTIIIEQIREKMRYTTTKVEIEDTIIKNIQNTYSKILQNNTIEIYIGKRKVEPKIDYFKIDEANLFIEKRYLYIKKLRNKEYIIEETDKTNDFLQNKTQYRIYNEKTKKYNKIKKKEFNDYLKYDNYYNDSRICVNENQAIIEIKATGLQFVPELDKHEIPKCKFNIFKINRHHGNYCIPSTNGTKNYIYGEIIFNSKKLGKDIGANYNKTINLKSKNDICYSIIECIKNISSRLEYDTSTKKSESFYKEAKRLGFNIPDDKIPTKFKNNMLNQDNDHVIESTTNAMQDNNDVIVSNTNAVQDNNDVIVSTTNAVQDNNDVIVSNSVEENDDVIESNTNSVEENDDIIESNTNSVDDNDDDHVIESNTNSVDDNDDDDVIESNTNSVDDNDDDDVIESNTNSVDDNDDDEVIESNSVDDNNYLSYNIKKIKIGKGEQIKLTKIAINTIFNNIEIFIKKSEETNKISFEDEICEKILKMIMVYYNKDDRCYNPLKNMAKKCGFIYMKEEYFELIKDKLDNDYVPGGSILHKYWSENF